MIISRNKAITLLGLVLLALAGISAMKAPQKDHKNLKVLPGDISDQQLDSIMETYSKALGVSCGFCHAAVPGLPDSLDFASDKIPMKESARDMMRMTNYLNITYFYFDKTKKPEELNIIRCMTCHHGNAFPAE